VLFRAEDLLGVDTRVELRVALPFEASDEARPEIFCHGRIARTVPPADAHDRPALAVTIEEYHFQRGETSPTFA
jgi:hypothetical protein